ncbi:hypothetical protein [Hymenobacter fodinae]|uniref:hypothetical protein n=1 Tax=Hymenobacter fodinae TaxID=2510796 RepID=UPI001436B922|nr:hypothetical protein [Hymenobacter fodinae]
MRSATAPKQCFCIKCRTAFISWKGNKPMCDKCWTAFTQAWAAEDARIYYTSPLAGFND